jgi:MoaA/NifB/PqqE/SkfB family radical SAM enzyme
LEQASKKFKKAGISSFTLLPLRDKNNHFYEYTKNQSKIIDQINFNSNKIIKITSNLKRETNTKGEICSCGYKYIFLHPDGKAFRCIPSSKSKYGYLGNILENNFSLYKKPTICKEKSCYCFGRHIINQFQKLYK